MSGMKRAEVRALKPTADEIWARHAELKAADKINDAPMGVRPSQIARALNDHDGGTYDIARLEAAELFEGSRPEISVIIPTKNTKNLLELCIVSVLTHQAYPTEIIIVDGGTDGTAAMVRETCANAHPAVKYVSYREGKSFAQACNRGALEASGRVMIFLNSDTVVTAQWDRELIGALKSGGLMPYGVGAAGPMSNYVKGKQKDYEAKYVPTKNDARPHEKYAWDKLQERRDEYIETRDLSGFCLAIWADVWDAVGEFDERFVPGNFEDNDWCNRCYLQGYRLLIARGSFVHHRGLGTYDANSMNNNAAFETNKERFLKKWGSDLEVSAHA